MIIIFSDNLNNKAKMALLSSTGVMTRAGLGRLRINVNDKMKAVGLIKRALATTMQRKGGMENWTYRRQNPRPGKYSFPELAATGVMTSIYWWIFWHVFTEPGHLFGGSYWGEFDYPDASQWTDEELGIPPDDYEG